MQSRQIVLASRPKGMPSVNDLRFEEKQINEVRAGEVLLKSWLISVDPYMRRRMNNVKSYVPSYEVDQPILGGVVAKVVDSKSELLATGDIVVGNLPWATFCTEEAEKLRKLDPAMAPPSFSLGILGMPGLTAYFGMMDIGRPKDGETVVVSGAAGAVGIVAGQIAKIKGCRVVGIAGTDEKCQLLRDEFGFDETINYKTEKSIRKAIGRTCPKGVDIYYDNVGGEISQGVTHFLNYHSRLVLCGQISQYNNVRLKLVPDILPRLQTRNILAQGFNVRNYSDRFGEGFACLSQWVKEGSIRYKETVVHGFDKLPETFLGLFSGQNKGKMLVEAD